MQRQTRRKGGIRDGEANFTEQLLGSTTRPTPIAVTDRGIEPRRTQIDRDWRSFYSQPDLRMLRLKIRQARHQPLRRERVEHADAERRAFVAMTARLGHDADLLDVRRNCRMIAAALRCEAQLPAVSHEQRTTEIGLQARNLLTHRTLGHVQFPRRCRETQMPTGRSECSDRVQGKCHSIS